MQQRWVPTMCSMGEFLWKSVEKNYPLISLRYCLNIFEMKELSPSAVNPEERISRWYTTRVCILFHIPRPILVTLILSIGRMKRAANIAKQKPYCWRNKRSLLSDIRQTSFIFTP